MQKIQGNWLQGFKNCFGELTDPILDFLRDNPGFSAKNGEDFSRLVKYLLDNGGNLTIEDQKKLRDYLEEIEKSEGQQEVAE